MLLLCRAVIAFLAGLLCLYIALMHVQPFDFQYSPLHAPVQINLAIVLLGLFALGFISGALIVWLGLMRRRLSTQSDKEAKLPPSSDEVVKSDAEMLPRS